MTENVNFLSPVLRYRVKIKIEDAAAWLAHLDLLRNVERALRRAKMPLRYSEGFNPHPLISWGPAHPVGLISLGEYFDLDFKVQPPPNWVSEASKFLPKGLNLLEARQIDPQTPALMATLNRAAYNIEFSEVSAEDLARSCQNLLNQSSLLFIRHSPKGNKELDLRPGILNLKAKGSVVEAVCLMGGAASPRPRELPELIAPEAIAKVIRTALYTE